jgi:hypothetical protein
MGNEKLPPSSSTSRNSGWYPIEKLAETVADSIQNGIGKAFQIPAVG